MIVGLTGYKQSGKSTFAKHVVAFNGARKLRFAEPIVPIMKMLGFTDEQISGDKKEVLDTFWNIIPRDLMKLIGITMFRDNFRADVWIKLAKKEIVAYKDTYDLVIENVRFPNEAELIRIHGGIIIKIDRGLEQNDNSISETPLPDNLIDFIITNFNSKENFKLRVTELWDELQNRKKQ